MIAENRLGRNALALELAKTGLTPAMEAAGVSALRGAGIGLLQAEDWEVLEVAREVYLAMASAAVSPQPKNPELSRIAPENTGSHP